MNERGSVPIWFLGLAFALLMMGALSAELWRILGERQELVALADGAAIAAASAIDLDQYRATGEARLDPVAAQSLALGVLGASGGGGDLSAVPVVAVAEGWGFRAGRARAESPVRIDPLPPAGRRRFRRHRDGRGLSALAVSERVRLVVAVALVGALATSLWMFRGDTEPDELAAAASALEAWGRWAGDGDLGHLAETFADGPQLAQLRREDAGIVPGPPYAFVLTGGELIGPGLVRGTVVLGREGEAEQRFSWDIELVEIDGVWRLWTVRTTA